jgi:cytochrome c oxidase assembly protein subunit 15
MDPLPDLRQVAVEEVGHGGIFVPRPAARNGIGDAPAQAVARAARGCLSRRMRAITRYAWSVLAVNLLVVCWGALVRATGSGAGCGKHWPTCNGELVPRAPATATLIEFGHRAVSGLAFLLVVLLVLWALRAFPRPSPARAVAWASLALIVAEALVGAGLVLYGWVAKDASAARGWVMAAHLKTTFLLLGALALTAAWSARPGGLALAGRGGLATVLGAALVAALLAGVTGAVAALGDTLYPATSFAAGLAEELSGNARLLLRLRVLHPFAAVTAAALSLVAARAALRAHRSEDVRRAAAAIAGLVAIEIAAGTANVLLLAPVWLQLVHLLLADLLWIALVLLAAFSLESGADEGEVRSTATPAVANV